MKMDGFIQKKDDLPRQLHEKYYRINGAIYLSDVTHFKTHSMIYDCDCYAYLMDSIQSIDIDTFLDFKMAEFLMEWLEKGEESFG